MKINCFSKFDLTKTLIFFLLSLLIWLYYTWYLDLFIAWRGWSPLAWMNWEGSESFRKLNFPAGYQHYDKSLPMYLHLVLHSLGISKLLVVKFVVFLEVIATGISIAIVVRLTNIDGLSWSSIPLSIVLLATIMLSGAKDLSLANIHSPFFVGLYYNFSEFFNVLFLYYVFFNKIGISSVFFSLSVMTHPSAAASTCLSVAVQGLSKLKKISAKSLGITFVSLGIVLVWIYFKIGPTGGVSSTDWISILKYQNSHWFPEVTGSLTFNSSKFLSPFLATFATTYVVLPRISRPETLQYLKSFFIGGLVVSSLGCIIPYFIGSPSLIKLALHRVSGLVGTFSVVFIICYAYQSLDRRDCRWLNYLCYLVLFSFWLPKSIVSTSILIIFSLVVMRERNERWVLSFPTLLIFVSLLVPLVFDPNVFTYLHSFNSLALVFLLSSFASILSFVNLGRYKLISSRYVILIGCTLVLSINSMFENSKSEKYLAVARDFKEVQVWARNNTSSKSVFMVDPTHYYGWVDFSERPSIGSIRDWSHNSWAYASDLYLFEESFERLSYFGIVKEDFQSSEFNLKQFSRKVDEYFYNLSGHALKSLTEKLNADFLVVSRKKYQYYKSDFPFEIVYKNKYFTVFTLNN